MRWQGSPQLKADAWANQTGGVTGSRRINPAARPYLAGHWPRDVELLEDALLRKHGRMLGESNSKARHLILRRYVRSPESAAQLRGIFAEAVYLDRHPNEGYVSKPNAAHNDVYRMDGRVPNGGQIKTKQTFSGSGYQAEMKRDFLAKRFIVPDDHVKPLRSYLDGQERKFQLAGNELLATEARRQSAKVRPLGATSAALETRLKSVAKHIAAEKAAPYVSLGVSTGAGLAPIIWSYANGELTGDKLLRQATRDISLRLTAIGADATLANVKGGALRGSAKGNLITGAAMFAVDSVFLICEYGGQQSFREAAFWEEIGGGASALTLGFSVGAPVTIYVTASAVEFGPAAPAIGATAGLMAGSLSGMVGYFGGKAVTRQFLDSVAPEIARKAEMEAFVEVRTGLDAMEKGNK